MGSIEASMIHHGNSTMNPIDLVSFASYITFHNQGSNAIYDWFCSSHFECSSCIRWRAAKTLEELTTESEFHNDTGGRKINHEKMQDHFLLEQAWKQAVFPSMWLKGPKWHVVGANKYVIAAKSISANILECTRKHVWNRRKYLKGLIC